jgi:hypothetical protein
MGATIMREAPLTFREQTFLHNVRLLVGRLVRAAQHLDDAKAAAFFKGEAAKLRANIEIDASMHDFAIEFERRLVAMTLRQRAELNGMAGDVVPELPGRLHAEALQRTKVEPCHRGGLR